ncbi:MAG: hypothetical protein ACTSQZ_03770 [Candidatus Thorarchaeota archaeon]
MKTSKKKVESVIAPTPPTTPASEVIPEPVIPKPETEDAWVKPSEVSRDRIRTTAPGTKQMSELEKARAIFAKADEAGIEEASSGIVEPRMLRASEVKEFLEGPTEIVPDTVAVVDAPVIDPAAPITEPPPIAAPSTEDMEAQILGSMSTLVKQDETTSDEHVDDTIPPVVSGFAPVISDEFSSSKYETSAETEAPIAEVVPETPSPIDIEPTSMDLDTLIPCPKCGEIVSKDMFEYPQEVYSAMGSARLKQARFFIVQGKYNQAQKIVRVARALYQKAGDTEGVAEIDRIVESLVQRA